MCPDLIRTTKNTALLKPSSLPRITRPLAIGGGSSGFATGALTAPAEPSKLTDPMIQITDFLFLGGSQVAESFDLLKAHDIEYIVNTAVEVENCFGNSNDFVYKRLDLQDHPAQHMCFVKVFENSFKLIDEARNANSRVLVHCRGGRSRSVTVVIAYLMRTYGLTLQQAYSYVQSKSPKISPNLGFMGQLVKYEAHLRAAREKSGSNSGNCSPTERIPFIVESTLSQPLEPTSRPATISPAHTHSPTMDSLSTMSSVTLGVLS